MPGGAPTSQSYDTAFNLRWAARRYGTTSTATRTPMSAPSTLASLSTLVRSGASTCGCASGRGERTRVEVRLAGHACVRSSPSEAATAAVTATVTATAAVTAAVCLRLPLFASR